MTTPDPEIDPRCGKPLWACVCDRVSPLKTKTRIVILQHPQEDDVVLGTARIVTSAIASARIVTGLSWASLEAVLDGEVIDRNRWSTVYAHKIPAGSESRTGVFLMDRHGVTSNTRVDGIVVLDGTWSQAKTLWWRNPWLLKLGRIALRPKEASIYGRMRREPRREHVSTLEAIGATLTGLREDPAIETELGKLMRTMVQRARDHGFDGRKKSKPAAAKKPAE